MSDPSPARVDDLPVTLLAVGARLVATFGGKGTHADRVKLARHLLVHANHAMLPADVLAELAVELATLTARVASSEEYVGQLTGMQRKIRHMAAGVGVAMAGRVEGQSLFTRSFRHAS